MVKPNYRDKTIGNWKIDKYLGGGGQGTVWMVHALSTRNAPPRAIKICEATEVQARQRFEREVRFLAAHASRGVVVAVLDQDLSWSAQLKGASVAYFVMELAEGTLDDPKWIDDTQTLLSYFRAACEPVDTLNERGDLHRDLKPRNILVLRELPRVRLCDLGVAATQADQGELTRIQEVVGSADYRAPEVQRGEPATPRSEVFSLGRVLQHLLCGTFNAVEIAATRHMGPRATQLLEDMICHSTHPNPAKRYATAGDLARALPMLELELPPSLTPVVAAAVQQPSEADVRGLVPIAVGEEGELAGDFARRRHPDAKITWRLFTPAFFMMHVAPSQPSQLTPLEAQRLLDKSDSLIPLGTSSTAFGAAAWPQLRAIIDSSGSPQSGIETHTLVGIIAGARGAAVVALDGNIAWRESGSTILDVSAVRAHAERGINGVTRFIEKVAPEWCPVTVTLAVLGAQGSRIERNARPRSTRNAEDVLAHRFAATDGHAEAWRGGLERFMYKVLAAHGEEDV